MSRSVSIFGVVVVMTVTVLATVAVAFAVPGQSSNGREKVEVCHKDKKTLTVGAPALNAHLNHGDSEGVCREVVAPEPPEGAPLELATPELTTMATAEVTLSEPPSEPISDTATLSGGDNPTGTITFNVYGPDDEDCSGEPAFTSEVDVNGDGDYSSDPTPSDPSDDFIPSAAGTYRWTADYSGDANNEAVSSECNAPNEQSVVNEASSATATEQNVTLAGEIGENTDPADPATDTSSIEGTNQNDNTTLGTDSDDHLFGDSSADILLSHHGNDFVDGGQGSDRMVGGAQGDYLNAADGRPGNDVINGGIGTDYCVGDVGDEFKNCDGNVVKVPVPPQSAAASN